MSTGSGDGLTTRFSNSLFFILVRQEVLEVFAEDYDAGDNARISYRILESPMNSNGAPIFSIDNSNRGLITCSTFLNREQQDVYYVTVEAKDNPTQPQEALTSKSYDHIQYCHVTEIWVNIGSADGMMPGGTKPLLEPMLTYQQQR